MMLTKLEVSNFKAWEKLDIKLGRVTGLFGTNSSGKSSILQFLLMLKQTKNATDRGLVLDLGGFNELVNLGTFESIVHKHQITSTLEWKIEWELSKTLKIPNPLGKRSDILFQGDVLGTKAKVSFKNQEMKSQLLAYSFDKHIFEMKPKESIKETKDYALQVNSKSSTNFQFVRQKGRVWTMPSPIKTHLFPDQAKTYYQNADFLSFFESEYESMMDQIYYLGPLREYPKREYPWSGASPFGVGSRGEWTIDAILSASNRKEKRSLGKGKATKSFQEIIAYWLKELGLIQSFSIKEIAPGSNIYQAIVKRDKESPEAFLTDVGFGVSQVLPALVLLYYVPKGSTILMEQPEIHLHPSVQSNLADVILQVAKHRNIQVIVESHSEHLLRRFQRRIAEEKYPVNELKLYFCDCKQGVSESSDLNLDVFGQISNWPENFFGDEMAEIAATRTAALKHKMRETIENGD
jgi:predicted ATPase